MTYILRQNNRWGAYGASIPRAFSIPVDRLSRAAGGPVGGTRDVWLHPVRAADAVLLDRAYDAAARIHGPSVRSDGHRLAGPVCHGSRSLRLPASPRDTSTAAGRLRRLHRGARGVARWVRVLVTQRLVAGAAVLVGPDTHQPC